MSTAFNGADSISEEVTKLLLRLDNRAFYGNADEKNGIIQEQMEDIDQLDSYIKNLVQDVSLRNEEMLNSHMYAICSILDSEQKLSHFYTKYIAVSTAKIIIGGLQECGSEGSIVDFSAKAFTSSSIDDLILLLNNLKEKLLKAWKTDETGNIRTIQIVKKYISGHYQEDLSLEKIAKIVHLSPAYLSSIFIKNTDLGISRYVRGVRLNKAKELLLETNMKIIDIGMSVGYDNFSYFCKVFAEEFGMTPSKFRQNMTITGFTDSE